MPIKHVKHFSRQVISLHRKALPTALLAVFGSLGATSVSATCVTNTYTTSHPDCLTLFPYQSLVLSNQGSATSTLELGFGGIGLNGSETSLTSVNGQSVISKLASNNDATWGDKVTVEGGVLRVVSPNPGQDNINVVELEGYTKPEDKWYAATFYNVDIYSDARGSVFDTQNNVRLDLRGVRVDARYASLLTSDSLDATINNYYMSDINGDVARLGQVRNTVLRINSSAIAMHESVANVASFSVLDNSSIALAKNVFDVRGDFMSLVGSSNANKPWAQLSSSTVNSQTDSNTNRLFALSQASFNVIDSDIAVNGSDRMDSVFHIDANSGASDLNMYGSNIIVNAPVGQVINVEAGSGSGVLPTNLGLSVSWGDQGMNAVHVTTTADNVTGIRMVGSDNLSSQPSLSSYFATFQMSGHDSTAISLDKASFMLDSNRWLMSGDRAVGLELKDIQQSAQNGSSYFSFTGKDSLAIRMTSASLYLMNSQITMTGANATVLEMSSSITQSSYLYGDSLDIQTAGDLFHVTSGDMGSIYLTSSSALLSPNSAASNRHLLLVEAQASNTSLGIASDSYVQGNVVDHSGTAVLNVMYQSVWSGAALRSEKTGTSLANLYIDESSIWDMQGSSVVNGLVNNGSIIINQPLAQADGSYRPEDYYTLTVEGDYFSDNGLLVLNQELGDSAALGDFFFVNGQASGTTRIRINKTAGLGARTTGNGILVIRAKSGASDQGQAASFNVNIAQGDIDTSLFVLDDSSELEAGAYRYSMLAKKEGTAVSWYLVSDYTGETIPDRGGDTTPDQGGDTSLPSTVLKPVISNYRPLVVAASVAPSMVQNTELMSLGTANTRYGTMSNHSTGGAWGRAIYSSTTLGTTASTVAQRVQDFEQQGAAYDLRSSGIQAGYDMFVKQLPESTIRSGVFLNVLSSKADLANLYQSDSNSAVDMTSYSVGGYFNWQQASGSYLDLAAQYTQVADVSIRAGSASALSTKGQSMSVSAEAGWTIPLSEGWSVQPQAQLLLVKSSLQDINGVQNLSMKFANQHAFYTRFGASLEKAMHTSSNLPMSVGLSASVWNNSARSTSTTVMNAQGDASTAVVLPGILSKRWVDVGLGLNGDLTKSDTISARAAYQHGLSGADIKGWSLQLNYTKRW